MLIGHDIKVVPLSDINVADIRDYILNTNSLHDYAEMILNRYLSEHVTWWGTYICRGWTIEKYIPGEKYEKICDDRKEHQSIVSVKLFLNDDYEGGEIKFINHDLTFSPSAGDILIYPSSYINTYNISEIKEGSQLVLAGYFKHKATAEG